MNKVCVLIRVYNRIEDLRYCLNIIRDTWKLLDYYIIVVYNGRKDGYIIDNELINKIDLLIEIENNVGHFNGNSQLLLSGLDHIPEFCDYTVILEADTWMYGDDIITTYIKKLEENNAVWASAQFFRYVANLATDFAIIKTSFLKFNRKIFEFSSTPEYYVANFLIERNYKYIYIKENMPISLPKYLRNYPFTKLGRFYAFEKSKMVTHHIEHLKRGIDEKKEKFNIVSRTNYFKINISRNKRFVLVCLYFAKMFSFLFPYKAWVVRKKYDIN